MTIRTRMVLAVMAATIAGTIGPARAQATDSFGGTTYDILGIELGASLEEARAGYRGSRDLETRENLFGAANNATGAQFELDFVDELSTPNSPVAEEEANDRIEVRLSTPETDGRVLQIQRSFDRPRVGDPINAATFRQSLIEKYGDPSFDGGAYLVWLHDESGAKITVPDYPISSGGLTGQSLVEMRLGELPVCWKTLTPLEGPRGVSFARRASRYYFQSSRRDALEGCNGGLAIVLQEQDGALVSASFLAVDNRLLQEDQAKMDARVVQELTNDPDPQTGAQPEL